MPNGNKKTDGTAELLISSLDMKMTQENDPNEPIKMGG